MAQNGPNLTDLKQYLNTCSKDELISDIAELFKRFDSVKDYYHVKVSPQNNAQILAKYKRIIENEFFPARGIGNARLSVAKKAIADYKKVGHDPASLADIMLFYVEQGVKFTNDYGDINESFYNSMVSMYEKTVQWSFKYKIQNNFQKRMRKIVDDTSGMGWGFHDDLIAIYNYAFNDKV